MTSKLNTSSVGLSRCDGDYPRTRYQDASLARIAGTGGDRRRSVTGVWLHLCVYRARRIGCFVLEDSGMREEYHVLLTRR